MQSLVELGPERMQIWFPGTFAESDRIEVPREEVTALSVVTFLHSNLDTAESAIEMIDLLGELIHEDAPELDAGFEALRPELMRVLFESDEQRLSRTVSTLQNQIVPNLVRASSVVDLRVHRPTLVEDADVGLVPVVLMRLTFDEPIGASNTIAFQLSSDAMAQLNDEITQASLDVDRATAKMQNVIIQAGQETRR